MAFVLTLLYVAISFLSPVVLPEAIWNLHVNIILGVAVILALIPQISDAKLGTIPDSYLILGLLFAAGISVVPLGFSAMPSKIIESVPSFIVFYFVLISCRSLAKLKILVYLLVGVALFIFAQGWIADHSHNYLSKYLFGEGTGDGLVYRYRGLGVLSDPNDLAQFFVTLIPLLWLRWKPGAYVSNLLLTILPAAALAVGMYFTHSRGGVIALLAVMLFAFKDKIGVVLSSMLTAGLFIGMMALNISGGRGMNDDDGGRVAAWSTGLELFKAHPLIGIGMDRFSEYNETGHTAHNSYVLVLAETGLLGYFCWMGAIVSDLIEIGTMARLRFGSEQEDAEDTRSGVVLPPHLAARRASMLGAPAALASRVPVATEKKILRYPGFAPVAFQGASGSVPATPTSWSPAAQYLQPGAAVVDSEDDEHLRHAARVFRIAFVGLLTSAFFLSRSFVMIFYVTLGMSAAVRMMYRAKHPEMKTDTKRVLRTIGLVIFGSVLFLYLFVRVRGLH